MTNSPTLIFALPPPMVFIVFISRWTLFRRLMLWSILATDPIVNPFFSFNLHILRRAGNMLLDSEELKDYQMVRNHFQYIV